MENKALEEFENKNIYDLTQEEIEECLELGIVPPWADGELLKENEEELVHKRHHEQQIKEGITENKDIKKDDLVNDVDNFSITINSLENFNSNSKIEIGKTYTGEEALKILSTIKAMDEEQKDINELDINEKIKNLEEHYKKELQEKIEQLKTNNIEIPKDKKIDFDINVGNKTFNKNLALGKDDFKDVNNFIDNTCKELDDKSELKNKLQNLPFNQKKPDRLKNLIELMSDTSDLFGKEISSFLKGLRDGYNSFQVHQNNTNKQKDNTDKKKSFLDNLKEKKDIVFNIFKKTDKTKLKDIKDEHRNDSQIKDSVSHFVKTQGVVKENQKERTNFKDRGRNV